MRSMIAALALLASTSPAVPAQDPPHVVFLIGESEYGSQDTMPAFATRLEQELQLRVTVLASEANQLPDLAVLDTADLLVLFLRFRKATDAQLDRLRAWFDAGKPCVALRTTSHAFLADKGWFPPFFGGHYKAHAPNRQGTRSYVLPDAAEHAVLRGIAPSIDLGHGGTYNAQPLADTATPLLLGRTGQLPSEPIAWINRYQPGSRIFYTSLGSRQNFQRDDFQRLLGNAVLWCLEREVPMGGAFRGGIARARFEVPNVPLAPKAQVPADAELLFDGNDASAWRHWDPSVEPKAIGIDGRADSSSGGEQYDAARWRIEDGALIARPGFGDIVTRESFGDYHLHFDFLVPREPDWGGAAFRGHSGVYLAGRYEIQIADSAGRPNDERSCGAIFGQRAPGTNAARRAGIWQSLDVHFRHLQDRDPIVSAWLNGEPIHERVTLRQRTTYGFRKEPPGARSLAKGGGLRYAREPEQSFRFGTGEFTIAARFRTKGNGTIASKSPPAGKWQPNAKALFLRGGRLVYDIGWVGQLQTERRFNDGKWHRVLLTHRDGEARLFVDGEQVADREEFIAEDEPSHVFKIGAASPDFGGAYSGEISDVTVFEDNVTDAKARQWTRGETINMGEPALEWRSAEKPAEKSAGPDRTVVKAPIRLQADSSPVRFANIWVRPLADVDHRGLIGNNDPQVLARGKRLYQALCASCHLPPKSAFRNGLQYGSHPRAIYDTLENGFASKPAMAWIPAQPRYELIHFLRQELALPRVDAAYLATQPAGMPAASTTPVAVDDAEWPAYRRMDYGNALHWTYQVGDDNIAQKGIAVRLDDGPGGISRGRAFLAYDHDTMRVAAAWTGEGFVDWKGVAFDASHNSHAHIVGDVAFTLPDGPGWANPGTGSFEDERLIGRDGRRFGPLPREWLRLLGRQQIGGRTVLEYTVGDTLVRESPGYEDVYGTPVFTRTFEIGPGETELWLRVASADSGLAVRGNGDGRKASLVVRDGFHLVRFGRGAAGSFQLAMTTGDARTLTIRDALAAPSTPLPDREASGQPLWSETVTSRVHSGDADGAFAVDEFVLPDTTANPWHSWMRLGGFDFFSDGLRAAVSTWNGDVWIVDGIDGESGELHWRRIAAGLYQPLGVKILDDVIYVGCRDQICVLEDSNGDGETDYYRCFNNDHQVTEHFHEFAMGLQSDAAGNFYYAKSARHAKTALVPHHGTLLKVAADGSKTEIVANGFRAANGICINGDGSFYVTDQEGHWTPKNRINRVVPGGFYGNMMGYHDRSSSEDRDMQQPLCWITNAFDRSPGELLRVKGKAWGLPENALLQLSYGMGRIFLVLEDQVGDIHQGAMVALPIEPFPTGIMRGRFHQQSGQLYCCGLYGWSSGRTRPGGFYRVRYAGEPIEMPTGMRVVDGGLELTFGARLHREIAEDTGSYGIKVWSLRRSKNYGSKHYDTIELELASARLRDDDTTVRLSIPDLQPTMCIEIRCNLETAGEKDLRAVIHGTIHATR